jgi:hypothetical protein
MLFETSLAQIHDDLTVLFCIKWVGMMAGGEYLAGRYQEKVTWG